MRAESMDDLLESRMRDVLLQLALLSNGRTASAAGGGGGERDYTPTLGPDDAPHEHFARRWDAASSDDGRRAVLRAATERLKHERRSSNTSPPSETKAQLYARIVDAGEGVAATELAIRMRTGVTVIRRARVLDGRESEYGRKPRNGRVFTVDQRVAEVERLLGTGMNARQIADALELSYDTVRRALGRRA